MILFYSVHCKHCSMLLDSVRRMDANGAVKLMNIESLKHTHPNVYQQLNAVPALMLLPSKEILYGKSVFDYLLLPARGKLVSSGAGGTNTNTNANTNAATPDAGGRASGKTNDGVGVLHIEEGVMAFDGASLSRGLYSDCFADINETQSTPSDAMNNPHSSFNWISIDEMMRQGSEPLDAPMVGIASSQMGSGGGHEGSGSGNTGMGVETRPPKESIDVDFIRRERDKDLQALLAGQTMPI